MDATFAPSAFAMFIAASTVFAGAEPPMVAAENSCAHAELAGPLDAMHALRTLARALIFATGAVPVAGNDAPGGLPVTRSTRFAAVAAASPMPLLLVAVAPIWAPVPRNGAIAHAAATVVASFTTTFKPLFNAEHCPITAIITAPLFDVPPTPAYPPRATRYNTVLLKGHVMLFAIVNAPVESVITGEVKSAVGGEPFPVVPAAYSCTLAPTIGNE